MKSIFLLLFINLTSLLTAFAQKPSSGTRKLQREIRQTIKKESIVSSRINWTTLDAELKSVNYTGKHSEDKEKMLIVFKKGLENAGDRHSLFISEEVSSIISRESNVSKLSSSDYPGQQIGYLRIPQCMAFD